MPSCYIQLNASVTSGRFSQTNGFEHSCDGIPSHCQHFGSVQEPAGALKAWAPICCWLTIQSTMLQVLIVSNESLMVPASHEVVEVLHECAFPLLVADAVL